MKRTLLVLVLASLPLASCTGGQTSVPPQSSVNTIAISSLQLAVGTANINGVTGLNVVTTLRQTSGDSILFDTPTLTGPLAFTIPAATANASGATWPNGGPSAAEISGGFIGSTNPANTTPPNQTGAVVTPAAQTTFGLYGGVSATGFHQSNSATNSAISTTTANVAGPSIVPFYLPIYSSTAAAKAVRFIPWVGPPAYTGPTGLGTRDGTFAGGLIGVDPGISVFDGVTPNAGTYSLSIVIPTGFTTAGTATSSTIATSATLKAPATSIGGGAAIAAPMVTLTGNGAASVTASLPSNATGALLYIVDSGPATGSSCFKLGPNAAPNSYNFAQFPVVYTIQITAAGTYALPGNIGPRPANGAAVHSICSAQDNTTANSTQGAPAAGVGDSVSVQMVAYNYNLPSLISALSQGVQTPALPTGDADIGVSAKSASVTSP